MDAGIPEKGRRDQDMSGQKDQQRGDIYTRITDKIVADLERGVRPWMQPWKAGCQRRRKIRPVGGAKPGQYSRHAGKRREGVARAVLACVRGDFRRSVQAVWPDFRALLWARR